jgi:hypothetical protein
VGGEGEFRGNGPRKNEEERKELESKKWGRVRIAVGKWECIQQRVVRREYKDEEMKCREEKNSTK